MPILLMRYRLLYSIHPYIVLRMAAPTGGSSISASNQLLMQTLLMLQNQNGTHQARLLAGAGTTVGKPCPPTQQQLIPDVRSTVQPSPSVTQPARGHLSSSGSSSLNFAPQGLQHNLHGHYGYAQPALAMQQQEQRLAQQHYDSMREPGQWTPQHQLPDLTHRQYPSHPQQPHAHGQPPTKRTRTTRPSEGDWVGAVDGRDVREQATPRQWSWKNDLSETAAHVPRIEAAWSGTVSTVSTSTLRHMRKQQRWTQQQLTSPRLLYAEGVYICMLRASVS